MICVCVFGFQSQNPGYNLCLQDALTVCDACGIWELIQTPTSSHGVWRLLGKGFYICCTAGVCTDVPDLKVVEI